MLDAGQLQRLDVGGPRFIPADAQVAPSCRWLHSSDEPIEAYRVALDADEGIDNVFGNARGATVISIAGFPAVETQSELLQLPDTQCIVVVDVADGEALQVNYDYSGSALPMTRDLACAKARPAAEMVMQTLIRRAGG